MIGRALLLVGNRNSATWFATARLCRELTDAGVEVAVASMHPQPERPWRDTGSVRMLSLQPHRWEPRMPEGDSGADGIDADDSEDAAGADDLFSGTEEIVKGGAAPVPGHPLKRPVARMKRPMVRIRRFVGRQVARSRAPIRQRFAAPLAARKGWAAVRDSAPVLSMASRSDLIVALDPSMVRAAWELGRRYPDPAVVLGVAGVQAVLADRWSEAPLAGERAKDDTR